jgi:hypothetical protein
VWSLKKFSSLQTIEGHKAEVNCVCAFSPGGIDSAVASGSGDSTVRILFNFLARVPNKDVIKISYTYDLEGRNIHIYSSSSGGDDSKGDVPVWPRMKALVKQFGPEQFFYHHYPFFKESVLNGRTDFLEVFLPMTRIGLIRAEVKDSLLQAALDKGDRSAIKVIVKCWGALLGSPPEDENDIIYDPASLIEKAVLLSLAKEYPVEFKSFICSISLIPARNNAPPEKYLYFDEPNAAVSLYGGGGIGAAATRYAVGSVLNRFGGRSSTSQIHPSDAKKRPKAGNLKKSVKSEEGLSEEGSEASAAEEFRFMWAPLSNAYDLDMIKAYLDVCSELDNVDIFDSEVGKLALQISWQKFGLPAHVKAFVLYLLYLVLSSSSIYVFDELVSSDHAPLHRLAYAMIIVIIASNLYFLYMEFVQILFFGAAYFMDIWNSIDVLVILTTLCGNALRLAYRRETAISACMLAVASIGLWFNILYYLRAFESTGPLVAMVMAIASNIRVFLLVLGISVAGFSQAFWLLTYNSTGNMFSRIDESFLSSFSFMMGNFDPSAFDGTGRQRNFGIFLSVAYMMVVTILLLNLLIALMGSTYDKISERGLAQWRMEQAGVMIELLGEEEEQTSRESDNESTAGGKGIQLAPSTTSEAKNVWSQRLIFVKRDPHLVDEAQNGEAFAAEEKMNADLAVISSSLADLSAELKSLREIVNSLKSVDK